MKKTAPIATWSGQDQKGNTFYWNAPIAGYLSSFQGFGVAGILLGTCYGRIAGAPHASMYSAQLALYAARNSGKYKYLSLEIIALHRLPFAVSFPAGGNHTWSIPPQEIAQ